MDNAGFDVSEMKCETYIEVANNTILPKAHIPYLNITKQKGFDL